MDNAQPTTETSIRQHAIALAALAHNGLVFSTDVFDRQRYEQAQQIAADLLTLITDSNVEDLQKNVFLENGYMTPKVDVRGGVFDDQGRILLIRDRSDERWTLPGGWCDVLEPPSLAVEREVEEESGITVHATKLVALHDRDVQGHQPTFPYHVYKLFFLCEPISHGQPSPVETMEIGWFDIENLPELSTTRVLDTQVRLLQEHWKKRELPTVFD